MRNNIPYTNKKATRICGFTMINERISIQAKDLGKSFKTKKSKRQIISQILKGDKNYGAEEKWVLKDINLF